VLGNFSNVLKNEGTSLKLKTYLWAGKE